MRNVWIVDGNNLAKILFKEEIPTREIGSKHINILATELGRLVISNRYEYEVELCLDSRPDKPHSRRHVRVYVADGNESADDLIERRTKINIEAGNQPIGITDDLTLTERVYRAGGLVNKATWMARRLSTRKFRSIPRSHRQKLHKTASPPKPPADHGRLIDRLDVVRDEELYPRTMAFIEQERSRRSIGPIIVSTFTTLTPELPISDLEEPPLHLEAHDIPAPESQLEPMEEPEIPVVRFRTSEHAPAGAFPDEQYSYSLNALQWSTEQTQDFLREYSCSHHREYLESLFSEIDNLKPGQVDQLLISLKESCSDEPNFLTQGCAIDRVKRALIKVYPLPLTIAEMETLTGTKIPSAKHKLQRDTPYWFSNASLL